MIEPLSDKPLGAAVISRPTFRELEQPHRLSEAVEHGGGRQNLVTKQISAVRQNSRDARADITAAYGGVPHRNARHVGNQVKRAGFAVSDAEGRLCAIKSHASCLLLL